VEGHDAAESKNVVIHDISFTEMPVTCQKNTNCTAATMADANVNHAAL
jgi:hypothetical protein